MYLGVLKIYFMCSDSTFVVKVYERLEKHLVYVDQEEICLI